MSSKLFQHGFRSSAQVISGALQRPRARGLYLSTNNYNSRSNASSQAWPCHRVPSLRYDRKRTMATVATTSPTVNTVDIAVDGETQSYSALLLRDLCSCSSCVDPSTKQKEFSTVDIPADIRPDSIEINSDSISIKWNSDISGFDREHTTKLSLGLLKNLRSTGRSTPQRIASSRTYWTADQYRRLRDFDFDAYMNDESVLLAALRQLHTHGLIFITNVPESEKSVVSTGERIGPLKTTFYGKTWEVRSVPNAVNVAYTSSNLGFHMDLMYMVQPPHLQLLHCMRSSSAGGASLFCDSFRAVKKLSEESPHDFDTLSDLSVDFHYDHPGSQYYHQSRRVIEQEPRKLGRTWVRDYRAAEEFLARQPEHAQQQLDPMDFVDAVSWAPPFQAPFSLQHTPSLSPEALGESPSTTQIIGSHTARWHAAGQNFNDLIHGEDGIYERMMQPGDCVIFDNRRVLHARRAFNVDDAGKERWLRGAYIDKDPYVSRMTVLESSAT